MFSVLNEWPAETGLFRCSGQLTNISFVSGSVAARSADQQAACSLGTQTSSINGSKWSSYLVGSKGNWSDVELPVSWNVHLKVRRPSVLKVWNTEKHSENHGWHFFTCLWGAVHDRPFPAAGSDSSFCSSVPSSEMWRTLLACRSRMVTRVCCCKKTKSVISFSITHDGLQSNCSSVM